MYENPTNLYNVACLQMHQEIGIRFAGIINKSGRKIAGGFGPKVIPLEKDQEKITMLMMELALDLSMRKGFNNSLGQMWAIVSYRENANIITIPHGENFMLLSSEPGLDPVEIIQIAYHSLKPIKIMEVIAI